LTRPIEEELKTHSEEIISRIRNNLIPFIPRGTKNYVDHGLAHSIEVGNKKNELVTWLGKYAFAFNPVEENALNLAIWTHDLGCIIDRSKNHETWSVRILKLIDYGIEKDLKNILLELIKYHSSKNTNNVINLKDKAYGAHYTARMDITAATLRLADALDVGERTDHRIDLASRAPPEIIQILTKFRKPNQVTLNHWSAHNSCDGVHLDITNNKVLVHSKYGSQNVANINQVLIPDIRNELKIFNSITHKPKYANYLFDTLRVNIVKHKFQ